MRPLVVFSARYLGKVSSHRATTFTITQVTLTQATTVTGHPHNILTAKKKKKKTKRHHFSTAKKRLKNTPFIP